MINDEGVVINKLHKFVTMITMPTMGSGIGAVLGYFIAVLVNHIFGITHDTANVITRACILVGMLSVAFMLAGSNIKKVSKVR